MIRRNIRLRKDYLYQKSQELKEQDKQNKRIKMQNAIDNDKNVPTELRKEKDEVTKDLALADKNTMVARSHIDDEYEDAKFRNPKLLITTSRDPSQRLVTF